MNMGLKDRIKRLVKSFKYAFNGFKWALKTEQNLWVHLIVSFLVIIFGLILNLNLIEWCICLSLFALVIGAELINTALERTVDLLEPKYNEAAKVVKDTAAAFVLVFALLSVIIGIIVFLPKIIDLWRSL
ncbi:MAG: diacylglycerol kinase family protein [Bacilli bacterium]|nr:diacylglycerol kinase family protein [Bacilli bacterium]MDD4733920.1 diacylglycerol kinase family protein [Bacilli bacterium]